MRQTISWTQCVAKSVAVLSLCGAATSALAIPISADVVGPAHIPADAVQLGLFYSGATSVATADFRYDSLTGLISYQVGSGSFSSDGTPWSLGVRQGLFSWSASIDQHGAMQGTGSASLMLDLGSGLELLASGRVIDFGLGAATCNSLESGVSCIFDRPQASIETTYADSRISSYLGNFWQWVGSMRITSAQTTLTSFRCSQAAGNESCGRYSGDTTMGHAVPVPEPTSLALIALGLLGVGLKRRR